MIETEPLAGKRTSLHEFVTEDGYTLHWDAEALSWTDGDLVFGGDPDTGPLERFEIEESLDLVRGQRNFLAARLVEATNRLESMKEATPMNYHLVRVTAVLAINTFGNDHPPVAQEHITLDEGMILGWEEEVLHVAPAEELQVAGFPVEEEKIDA